MTTRGEIKKLLKVSIIALVSLIVISYAIFASHDFIVGPYLVVSEPVNGSTFSEPKINIIGVTKRIQDISLNGRSITIDEEGNFKETTILAPGYNIFTLIAKDKFERQEEYRLELIYKVN